MFDLTWALKRQSTQFQLCWVKALPLKTESLLFKFALYCFCPGQRNQIGGDRRQTMARVGEINRLTWDDVNLYARYVILYTRKKSGGHLTPRKVPMTGKLHEVLSRRYQNRDASKPWVFWHRYWSRDKGDHVEGSYDDRKKIMKKPCKDAKVRYFRFHPIRHSGASIMDGNNVPLGAIQRILGHENRRTTGSIRTASVIWRGKQLQFSSRPEKSLTQTLTQEATQRKRGYPMQRITPLPN
jgi:Phage integrase family